MSQNTPLIIHDLCQIKGGGERLVYTLCQGLAADLVTGHIGHNTFDFNQLGGEVIDLNALSRIHGIKTWALARAFKQLTPPKPNNNPVIYSGVASPLAVQHYPQARNVFYCHTPPRFVYDKQSHYANELGPIKRLAFKALINWFKPQYEAAVEQMDVVLTNSEFVRKRIQKHLGLPAEVVYPPCDTAHFRWHEAGDYYLSLARHDELKRIDQIIEAFKLMPDKKLVVASGGEQTSQLKKAAAGHDNIHFTGWLSEADYLTLLGGCLATVYIPLDEDFGMTPVESMSAGKPVICSDHGGMLESVLNQETGLYVSSNSLVNDLISQVNALTQQRAMSMRSACEQRAKDFDTALFMKKIKEFL